MHDISQFEGDTQHIENHFSEHSNSGSVSVGWGPFSVSSRYGKMLLHCSLEIIPIIIG
jgi:hypothetical protein